MRIPGIPDSELERVHWNYGQGRGAYALRHLPSGLTVGRECLPGAPSWQLEQELLAELTEKLRSAGLLSSEPQTKPKTSPG